MATSTHFSEKELRCHHCLVNLTKPELVNSLEALRALISTERGKDTSIHVNSAYRCQIYDTALQLNAAKKIINSMHVQGLAADISVAGMTAAELMTFAIRIPAFKGLGRDDFKNYIHVDAREDKPGRWCYAIDGDWIPWYEPKPVSA